MALGPKTMVVLSVNEHFMCYPHDPLKNRNSDAEYPRAPTSWQWLFAQLSATRLNAPGSRKFEARS